jgi:hypothetical protein
METDPREQVRRAVVVGEVVQYAGGFGQQGVGAALAAEKLTVRPGWPVGHSSSPLGLRRRSLDFMRALAIAVLSSR